MLASAPPSPPYSNVLPLLSPSHAPVIPPAASLPKSNVLFSVPALSSQPSLKTRHLLFLSPSPMTPYITLSPPFMPEIYLLLLYKNLMSRRWLHRLSLLCCRSQQGWQRHLTVPRMLALLLMPPLSLFSYCLRQSWDCCSILRIFRFSSYHLLRLIILIVHWEGPPTLSSLWFRFQTKVGDFQTILSLWENIRISH